jgi:hypothetical protein
VWVDFASHYFVELYRGLVDGLVFDPERRAAPFYARDLNRFIPSAGAHPISTPSHTFGMLCTLADEGYLSIEEHPESRQIAFRVQSLPPEDYLKRRLAEDPGPLPIFKRSQRSSSAAAAP